MGSPEVKKLLNGPLVKWFSGELDKPESLKSYKNLVDGELLHEVFLKIDPEAFHGGFSPVEGNTNARVANLDKVWKNVRYFYEEELGSVILKVPDMAKLGEAPDSHTEEMKLLLTLLLGCAVQCVNNDGFISRMLLLDEEDQIAIRDCILEVTEGAEIVLSPEKIKNIGADDLFRLIKHFSDQRHDSRDDSRNNLDFDRSTYYSICGDTKNSSNDFAECEFSTSRRDSNFSFQQQGIGRESLESSQLQMRKLRHDQERMQEAFSEVLEELEEKKSEIWKLRDECQSLQRDLKVAKNGRDLLDMALEKAAKAEKLEHQVASFREKCEAFEFYKHRVDELFKENNVLFELKESLEEELRSSRQQTEKATNLEDELLRCQHLLDEKTREYAVERERYHELFEENARLQNSRNAGKLEIAEGANDTFNSEPGVVSVSEQLTDCSQARILELELDNFKLRSMIYELNQAKDPKLQKTNKKLSAKLRLLKSRNDELGEQNKEMAAICKEAAEQISSLAEIASEKKRKYSAQKCKYEELLAKYLDRKGIFMDGAGRSMQLLIQNPDDFRTKVNISFEDESKSEASLSWGKGNGYESGKSRENPRESIYKDIVTYNLMALTVMFLFWKGFSSSK